MLGIIVIVSIILAFLVSWYPSGHDSKLAWSVDIMHLFITHFQYLFIAWVFYEVVVHKVFDIRKLLALNIFYFCMIAGVVYYKMCPLTIIYNKLEKLPKCTPFIWDWRKRFDKETFDATVSMFMVDNDECDKNTKAWLAGQTYTVLVVLSLNVLFLIVRSTYGVSFARAI
jgi:hypothetical protein